jgi:hypothetical protein
MVGTMDSEDVMMAFSFNIGWCIFVTQDKVELGVKLLERKLEYLPSWK